MPRFEVHCQDCKNELGETFAHVHKWLDELFGYLGSDHRYIRHNKQGVEKVRRMWGDKAAKAAEIHIQKDEGKIPEINDQFRLSMAIKPPHIYQTFLKEYDQ